MKILIFSPAYSSLGGMEQVAQNLAREFVAGDHQVLVVTTPDEAEKAPALPGVKNYAFPLAKIPRLLRRVSRWQRFFSEFPESARSLRSLTIAERPDVVLMNCHRDRGAYAACFPGAAVTATIQNWAPLVSAIDGWNLRKWLGRCAWVFPVSEWVRLNMMESVPALQGRCETIWNGTRYEEFERRPPYSFGRPYILGFGRLVIHKGFDVLCEAFRRVAREIPEVDLVIAGDGREAGRLKAGAADMEGRIHFFGRTERDQVPSLIVGSLFVAVPSRFEPFGIVCLEAMAAGKAVLASRVGGLPEVVVDGETGVLVPPEDPAALANAILRLVANREMCEALGREGTERVRKHFSWSVAAKRYLDRFESLLEGRKFG